MSRDTDASKEYPARVSFAVCGHHRREQQAHELAQRVGGRLALDDGSFGELANHDRAWGLALDDPAHRLPMETPGNRWCVVLEDDAVVPDDFPEQAAAVLADAHDGVVSFYLGAERPVEWQSRISGAIGRAESVGASWLTSRHLLWGVAVALPRYAVGPMLRDLGPIGGSVRRPKYMPYDERLSAWARRFWRSGRPPVAYTWPSLADHADGPTLISHADGQPRDRPRTAWAVGRPVVGGPSVEL